MRMADTPSVLFTVSPLTMLATRTLRAGLEAVDLVLVAIRFFTSAFGRLVRLAASRPPRPRPKVVIVGASFAGLWAQRELSGRFDVTLIDMKEYFEYTPGVLRAFVEPSHLFSIAKKLPSKRCQVIVGYVQRVRPDRVEVVTRSANADDGPKEVISVPFDYLLLAPGSAYNGNYDGRDVVKVDVASEQTSLESRMRCWQAEAARLRDAESAIVVGGGPVGVELAAEIAAAYPAKRVTLVSRSRRLCATLPETVGAFAQRWLERHRVEVLTGAATQGAPSQDGRSITLVETPSPGSRVTRSRASTGRILTADVIYNCACATPNTAMLRDDFAGHLDERGRLVVNDHLQIEGYPHIFGMGDAIIHPPSDELKLGHTAELNAHVVVANVIKLSEGADVAELERYPEGAHGCATSPRVYCVSLGKHAAVMSFNGVVLGGWLPAIMKWLLEWTKVAACEERPVGTLFWKFADAQTAWITRYLLPVSEAKAGAAKSA